MIEEKFKLTNIRKIRSYCCKAPVSYVYQQKKSYTETQLDCIIGFTCISCKKYCDVYLKEKTIFDFYKYVFFKITWLLWCYRKTKIFNLEMEKKILIKEIEIY